MVILIAGREEGHYNPFMRRLIILGAVFIAVLFAVIAFQENTARSADLQEAVVTKVHDGDTVTLKMDGKKIRARLLGIDAPEIGQRPWGRKALEHFEEIVGQSRGVVLAEYDVEPDDQYERRLVYLHTKNRELINERMVRDGYALAFNIPPNTKYAARIKHAQQQAKDAGVGIWGPKGLKERPSEWRRKNPRKDRE